MPEDRLEPIVYIVKFKYLSSLMPYFLKDNLKKLQNIVERILGYVESTVLVLYLPLGFSFLTTHISLL